MTKRKPQRQTYTDEGFFDWVEGLVDRFRGIQPPWQTFELQARIPSWNPLSRGQSEENLRLPTTVFDYENDVYSQPTKPRPRKRRRKQR